MMQYQVDLRELADILKAHYGVSGPAKVDLAFSYRAGRAAEAGGPELPTIVTQITGIVLTVEVPSAAPSRPRRRTGTRRPSKTSARA